MGIVSFDSLVFPRHCDCVSTGEVLNVCTYVLRQPEAQVQDCWRTPRKRPRSQSPDDSGAVNLPRHLLPPSLRAQPIAETSTSGAKDDCDERSKHDSDSVSKTIDGETDADDTRMAAELLLNLDRKRVAGRQYLAETMDIAQDSLVDEALLESFADLMPSHWGENDQIATREKQRSNAPLMNPGIVTDLDEGLRILGLRAMKGGGTTRLPFMSSDLLPAQVCL